MRHYCKRMKRQRRGSKNQIPLHLSHVKRASCLRVHKKSCTPSSSALFLFFSASSFIDLPSITEQRQPSPPIMTLDLASTAFQKTQSTVVVRLAKPEDIVHVDRILSLVNKAFGPGKSLVNNSHSIFNLSFHSSFL